MAEAVASNLISTITSPAFRKAYEKIRSICSEDELNEIKRSIDTIQAVLLDAEKKQESSAAVKIWMKGVRNVLYNAEDLFDEVATDDMLRKQIKGDKFLKKVRGFASSSLIPIVPNNSISKKVKGIRKSLLQISEDMKSFQFVECLNERPVYGMWEGQDSGAFVDSKNVIGRDEDEKAILEMLKDESNDVQQDVSVIAIVGIGGMGKTTLAQLIYNRKEVGSFEKWFAHISDASDNKEVLGKILQSICGEMCMWGNLSVNALNTTIKACIENKKFLLVLDDVWDDDPSRWQDRLRFLSSGVKGSKIIVTMRSLSAAKAIGATKTHKLDGLSDDDSWDLFKRVAGITPEQERDLRWTNLGKEIVKKCANVPLAIKIMASLLFEKKTIEEWESFRNEELPKLGEGHNDGIKPMLKLSYDHLPSNLKPCFAYCALFPKGYEFWKNELIYLWISQGYIKSTNEKKQTVEDVGHSYFMDLFRRSFFQDAEPYYEPFYEPYYDDDMRCKMHDLLHDLAQHVAGKESVMLTPSFNKIDGARHVSVCGYDSNCSLVMQTSAHNVNHLRSFISCGNIYGLEKKVQFAEFKLLRALSLPHLKIENVPSCIGELRYLRYLNVSGNKFKKLPHSITKLVNLCTLNISQCPNLEMLPNDFRKLISLRHLINKKCHLMHMPQGFEELTSLQRLDEFIVGIGTGGRRRSGLDVLLSLELKGHLEINFIDDKYEWGEVKCWQLPLNLQGLRIYRYHGVRIPQWSNGPSILPLTCLHLSSCSRVKCLPPLRHIPYLNDLSLLNMPELEYIEGEDGDLRKQSPEVEAGANELFLLAELKELMLEDLPKLKGWWRRIEAAATRGKDKEVTTDKDRLLSFPSLSKLHISRCPEFNSMLVCPRLCFLEIVGTVNMEVIQQLLSTCDNSSCLESVEIIACDELVSFQGESLTSLQRLTIRGCMNLREVHLASSHFLEDLSPRSCPVVKIVDCPEFVGRCEHGRGQDWHCALDSCGSEIEVIGKGRATIFTPAPPPPPPPPQLSFHQNFAPLAACRILRNDGLDSQGRDTIFTPPPPPPTPPPPPSFHQNFAPLIACRVLRNGGLDSQGDTKLGDPNQETDVEKDAASNEFSELDKTQEDQLPDSIGPSNELGSSSKGMLFLFYEGFEFEKEKLIQLWMAMGFIKDEPLEINGAIYFEKLMSEGYILPSDSSSLYQVNTEKVNSDLGMIQDKSKYLILESTSQHIAEPEDILHVSVVYDDINDAILKTLDKFKNLNTLSFHGSCGSRPEQVLDIIFGFTSLTVLDLSGTDIKELPSSVGKMVHLKYLDLSWTLIELLPEAMSCLHWLQTLKLKGCSRLRRLPRQMKLLTELRHLDFNILGQLTVMPKGLGALVKLQTLSAFLVGAQEGFNIRELRELDNLTGDFCIARLENVKSADDSKWASISTKKCLKNLDLRWSDFPLRDLKNEVVDDSVLKTLRPHSDLEELQIRCYGGPNLPTWIADESFHKLARVILFKCEHVSMLPSLQKLPSLEYIELISLNSVVKVDVRGENGHVAFPKLQKLILDEMLNLSSWTEAEEGDFPCLAELIIKDCPNLSELPSLVYLSSMKRLEICTCPQVQLLPDKKLSTSLEFLIVEDCPLIKKSCLEQEGHSYVLRVDDDSDYGIETEDEDGAEDANGNGWL